MDKRDTGDMSISDICIPISKYIVVLKFEYLLENSRNDLEKRRKGQLQFSGWWLMTRRIDGIRLRFACPPEYLEKLKMRNDRKHPIDLRMFVHRQLHGIHAGKHLRKSSDQMRQSRIVSRCACGLP